ncbi:MFS transporter [Streptosporangium carneum]|uniref:MFS transporter n=1 Tax=Streptosporangium carneum TaxID=47481 RepID=A0A9W6I3I0_9ACTN|nr:MFS transporter [Streptosporangium carneum]GLK11387.1 MFS transporter [Streptosporangium carneum]
MNPFHRWRALALLCTANFMVILDSQIVLVALPSMERQLGLSPGEGQWILTANLLTFGGLLLLGGRAADLLGRRRVFQVGTALFLVVSLLSGLAVNGLMLVVVRAVHGVSAAMMAPAALSILTTTFEEGADRNRALAAWSGIGGIGATSGLLLGGVLTQSLGWQWVFFINVPVAALLLALSPALLPESYDRGRRESFDLAGAVTVTGSLVLLVYAIVQAPTAGWTAPLTIGLFVLSAVLLLLFVVIETRSAAPLLPPAILRLPRLAGGNMLMVILAMSAFGLSFLVAMYTQQVLGYSPFQYGFSTSVMPVTAVVGAYVAQFAVTRTGTRPVGAVSMVLMGAGLLLLTQAPVGGVYARDLLPALLLFGAGLGGATIAGSVAALAGVAEHDSGLASGINAAAFQLGGALGIALIATVVASTVTGPDPAALAGAFQSGFAACAVFAAAGLLVSLALLGRRGATGTTGAEEAAPSLR